MAKKATGKKYNNYGYVLTGKPGKRRWRKREQAPLTKKTTAVLDFVNTGTALANRNRRERSLLDKALVLPATEENRRQRRRAFIRAGVYAAAVTATTGVIVSSVFKQHRAGNIKIAREAADEIGNLVKKRYDSMAKIVGTGSIKNIDGVLDDTFGDLRNAGRRSVNSIDKDNVITRMIAAARGEKIYDLPGSLYGGKPGDPVIQNVLTPAEARRLLKIKDHLDKLDDKVLDNIDNLRRRLREPKVLSRKAKEAIDYLDRLEDHVRTTNIANIAKNKNGAAIKMARDTTDGWLEDIMDSDLYQKMKGSEFASKAAGMRIDDVFDTYMAEKISGPDSVYRGADNLISDKTIFGNAKGFKDDFMTGVRRRKKLMSDILRTGEIPEYIQGSFKPKRLSRNKAGKVPDVAEEMAKKGGYRPKSEMVLLGESPGVSGAYRPAPLGGSRLGKREKLERVVNATLAGLRPTAYTDEGAEALATIFDASYKGTAAAHTGAFIGHSLSKGIIDSIERNEDIEDGIQRENLLIMNLKNAINQRDRVAAKTQQRAMNPTMRKVMISDTNRRYRNG